MLMLEGFVWRDAENGPAFHLCGTLKGVTFLYGDDSSAVANYFIHPQPDWHGEFSLDGRPISDPISAYILTKYADLTLFLEEVKNRENPNFLFLDFSHLNALEQSLSLQRILEQMSLCRLLIYAPEITPRSLGVNIGNEWSPYKETGCVEDKTRLAQAFDGLIGDLAWDKEPPKGSLVQDTKTVWLKTPSIPESLDTEESNNRRNEKQKDTKVISQKEDDTSRKHLQTAKRNRRFNWGEISNDFKKNWVNHAFFFLFEALSFCVLILCKCSQNITPLFFGLSIGLNALFAFLCALPISFIAEDNGNDQLTPSLKFGFACSFVLSVVGIVLSVVFSLSAEERRIISYFAIPYGASPLLCYLACYYQWRKAERKKEDKH